MPNGKKTPQGLTLGEETIPEGLTLGQEEGLKKKAVTEPAGQPTEELEPEPLPLYEPTEVTPEFDYSPEGQIAAEIRTKSPSFQLDIPGQDPITIDIAKNYYEREKAAKKRKDVIIPSYTTVGFEQFIKPPEPPKDKLPFEEEKPEVIEKKVPQFTRDIIRGTIDADAMGENKERLEGKFGQEVVTRLIREYDEEKKSLEDHKKLKKGDDEFLTSYKGFLTVKEQIDKNLDSAIKNHTAKISQELLGDLTTQVETKRKEIQKNFGIEIESATNEIKNKYQPLLEVAVSQEEVEQLNQQYQSELSGINDKTQEKYQSELDTFISKINTDAETKYNNSIEKYLQDIYSPKILNPKDLESIYDEIKSSQEFLNGSYGDRKKIIQNRWETYRNELLKKDGKIQIDEAEKEFYFGILKDLLFTQGGTASVYSIKSWAEDTLDDVDTKLRETEKEKEDILKTTTTPLTPYSPEFVAELNQLSTTKVLLEKILQHPEEDEAFWTDFGKGFTSLSLTGYVPFIATLVDLSRNIDIYKVAKKAEKGEELSTTEKNLLDTYASLMQLEDIKPTSTAYNVGSNIANMLPYIGEFALTAGAFAVPQKLAKTGLTKLLKKEVKKIVEEAVEKKIKKTATDYIIDAMSYSIGALGQTAANPQQYINNTIKRMTPEVQMMLTDQGNGVLTTLQGGEDFGEAFLKGFGMTYAEFFTEHLGSHLIGLPKNVFNKVTNTEWVKRSILGGWMRTKGLKTSQDAINDIIKRRLGWNGIIEEYSEEFVNARMSNLITGDRDVWDIKGQEELETLLTVGIFGAPFQIRNIVKGKTEGDFVEVNYSVTNKKGETENLKAQLPKLAIKEVETLIGKEGAGIKDLNKIIKKHNLDRNQSDILKSYLHEEVTKVIQAEEKEPIPEPPSYSVGEEILTREQAESRITEAKNIKDLEDFKIKNDPELDKLLIDKAKNFGVELPTEEKPEPEEIKKEEQKKIEEREKLAHQIRKSEDTTTLDDMTKGGKLVPDDFYTNPEFYADLKMETYKESWNVIKKAKDNPEAEITIYRAAPEGKGIETGDWISLSKQYAKEHGMHETDPGKDLPVIEMKVKAKDVVWDGNDMNEFAYYPTKPRPTEVIEKLEVEKIPTKKPEKERKIIYQTEDYSVEKEGNTLFVISDKADKITSSKKRKEVIDKYKNENVDKFKEGKKVDIPGGMTEEEVTNEIINESENPQEVAQAYLMEKSRETPDKTADDHIASKLMSTKIPRSNLERWGPVAVKRRTGGLETKAGQEEMRMPTLKYTSKDPQKTISADVLAMELSEESGMEITPQMIVDFIFENPTGSATYFKGKDRTLKDQLADRFFELTGFDIDEEYAKKLTTEEPTKPTEVEEPTEKAEMEDVPFQDKAILTTNKTTEDSKRIPPAPIREEGKKVKRFSEILFNLEKSTNVKIFFGKTAKKRALGHYKPTNAEIVVRSQGNLDTTAHELGHSLDDRYKILPKGQEAKEDWVFDMELRKFWVYGSEPPKGHKNPRQYRRGEGIAEFIRTYIANPQKAKEQAPEFYKHFENIIPSDILKGIKQFGEDYRVWVGASYGDQINSQVEPIIKERKISIKDWYAGFKSDPDNFQFSFWHTVAQKITNSSVFFEKAWEFAKHTKGLGKIMQENDAVLLARLFAGITSKVDNMFKNGLRNYRGIIIKDDVTNEAMSQEWLLGSVDLSTEQTIQDELEDVVTYMVAGRTIELPKNLEAKEITKIIKRGKLVSDEILNRHPKLKERLSEKIDKLKEQDAEIIDITQPDTVRVLTGIGGGIFDDIEIARGRIEEVEKMKEENPEKYKRIVESARRYREWANNNLRYLVDSGRLSEEEYAIIKENNDQYVALNRILEISPDEKIVYSKTKAGGGIGQSYRPIHAIKGSAKRIKNPYRSLIDATYLSIREADRNNIMRTYVDMFKAERDMYEGDVKNFARMARKAKQGDPNTIIVYNKGKKEFWQFDERIYSHLKNLRDSYWKLPPFLTFFPQIIRNTIIYAPPFAGRNTIRDFVHRLVVSRTARDPIQATVAVFKKYKPVGETITFSEVKSLGADQASYYFNDEQNYYKFLRTTIFELSKDKKTIVANIKKLAKFPEKYVEFIGKSELPNRMAEFRTSYSKFKKEGLDDYNAKLQAAFETRDLLDFAVAGEWIRVITQMIPFTNAQIQGMRRDLKAIGENPLGFTFKWSAFVVLPEVLTWLASEAMGDSDERRQQPAWMRDLFWSFKVAPDMWLRIPKPFELGVLGSGVSRTLDRVFYDDKQAFEGYGVSLIEALVPIGTTPITPVGALGDLRSNYNAFMGKYIIPPDQKKLKEEYKRAMGVTDRASRLGKALTKYIALDAVDPRNVDYFIRNTLNFYGDIAMRVSDIGREERKGFGKGEVLELTGFFRHSEIYGAKDVQWVLDFVSGYGLINRYGGMEKKTNEGKAFNDLQDTLTKYWKTKDKKDRDYYGKLVRNKATRIRLIWEKTNYKERLIKEGKKKKK